MGADKVRKRPVPIPGRISNAELQAEIDATLKVLATAKPTKKKAAKGRKKK